jgi:hypothetical protein
MRYAILATLVAAMLSGCATESKYHVSAAASNGKAQILGYSEHLTTATLLTVDGHKVGAWPWQRGVSLFRQEKPISVDAGDRVLSIRCEADTFSHTRIVYAQFDVSLQSGRIYHLECERNDSVFTLWLEDQATHLPVCDKQTVTNSIALPVYAF